MAKLDDKIDGLEAKLKELRARKQRTEARQRALHSRRERREDTRRKILVGSVVLAKVDQGVLDRDLLMHWLDGALVRPDDRRLFELPASARGEKAGTPVRRDLRV